MGAAHSFYIDDLSLFVAGLEARDYRRNPLHADSDGWIVYSKILSHVLIKHYSYSSHTQDSVPVSIRVTYDLIRNGVPLNTLANRLKKLNALYRQTLPGWKTKRKPRSDVRHRRWMHIQHFLQTHSELIACFKYSSDDRLTEGNHSFNVHIASTPKEQTICFAFIKALVEAYTPEGITRGHRGIDRMAQQRNGWIRRFAIAYRKRGWSAKEIVQEAQRELREGTWNERSKLQYNLSPQTISKIAGLKLQPHHRN